MNGDPELKNGTELPEKILLRLFPEAGGETQLIEDNGLLPADPAYRRAVTRIRMERGNGLAIEILPPEGEVSLLPAGRCFSLEICGVSDILPDLSGCGYASSYDAERRILRLELRAPSCRLAWSAFPEAPAPDRTRLIREILERAQIAYDLKIAVFSAVRKHPDPAELAAELHGMSLSASLFGAILEILSCF